MKAILFSLLFTLTFGATFSQNLSFGINFGLIYNDFQIEEDFSLSNEINDLTSEAKPGFHLGIHSLFKIANRVKISPQLQLAFTENAILIDYNTDQSYSMSIENVFIKVPLDLHLELLKGKTSLYLVSGVEYLFNFAGEDEVLKFDLKKEYWSGRIGIGMKQDLQRFSISPELTFAKSFGDLESGNEWSINQVITGLDNSMLSLNLKFQGLLSN